MESTIKYLAQGQLGDLIHSICVCKKIFENTGKKADIFISDKHFNFLYGIQITYSELKPVLLMQNWVNSVSIHKGELIDIDLTDYRINEKLFKTNWLELHFSTHLPNEIVPKEYSWIEMPINEEFSNCLIINRSLKPSYMSKEVQDRYRSVLEKHEKKYFICTDKRQYDIFPLKGMCKLVKVKNLYDFFVTINSCKLYLGNQSAPTAMAVAMNVPRIVELRNNHDGYHYINDVNYYSKYEYFIGDGYSMQ